MPSHDALDMGEREPGKARLQETVDPHVVLVGRDHDGLHLGRKRQVRAWSGQAKPKKGPEVIVE